MILCPCYSGAPFSDCCEKFITRLSFPTTAEQLMRSRYSAYHFKNADYLLKTWHASTRPADLDLTHDSTQWKKLKIISTTDKQVEFVAFFAGTDKTLQALYEKSLFIKEARWFYLQGEELKILKLTKKMLCPCKSGKKFKHCCGAEL